MRAVVQRCRDAEVRVAGERVGGFAGEGLVVLAGATHGDGQSDIDYLARKIADLRILRDERSAGDVDAPVLLVSQFTLYADIRKGRRPSWNGAASRKVAEPLIERLAAALRTRLSDVTTGVFGADMALTLTNDGPVTLWLESPTDPPASPGPS